MGLTYKDGIATVLAGVVVAVTLAVTQAWDWPLLGSTRAGIAVLGVVGLAMCITGSRTSDIDPGEGLKSHPTMIVEGALGVAALVVTVIGLFVGTEAWLVAQAAIILAMWVIATLRHMFSPGVSETHRLAGAH